MAPKTNSIKKAFAVLKKQMKKQLKLIKKLEAAFAEPETDQAKRK